MLCRFDQASVNASRKDTRNSLFMDPPEVFPVVFPVRSASASKNTQFMQRHFLLSDRCVEFRLYWILRRGSQLRLQAHIRDPKDPCT